MAKTPQYTASPKNAGLVISTANTNRDGTGSITNLYTATTNGDRIDDISIKAIGTTTAGMIRLFLHNGTDARLWREVPVSAITPSATVASWEFQLKDLGLLLESGWSLRASTHNAESFALLVTRGGPF